MKPAAERRLHHGDYMNILQSALKVVVVGGAGLAAMELVRRATASSVKQKPPEPMDVFPTARTMSLYGVHHRPDESATDALGRIAYEKLTGKSPSGSTKRALSWAVHIGYGLVVASLFVVLRRHPRVLRDGFLFGAGLWLFGDELAVPLLGLADKPTAYHPTRHAQSFAEHVGFGLTTAAATRALEAVS